MLLKINKQNQIFKLEYYFIRFPLIILKAIKHVHNNIKIYIIAIIVFFNSDSGLHGEHTSLRILNFTLFSFGFLFIIFYSATLVAKLSTQVPNFPVNSLEDIAAQDEIKICVQPNISADTALKINHVSIVILSDYFLFFINSKFTSAHEGH